MTIRAGHALFLSSRLRFRAPGWNISRLRFCALFWALNFALLPSRSHALCSSCSFFALVLLRSQFPFALVRLNIYIYIQKGQAERDRQKGTGRAGLDRTGQAERGRVGLDRTGQAERGRVGLDRTGQAERDRRNGTG